MSDLMLELPGSAPLTLGEILRRHRLALRAQRLEQVIAALEERLQDGGVAPSPLRHTIHGFAQELDDTRAQLLHGRVA